MTSSSVSPGSPIMKYSLICLQPLSHAVLTPRRSSWLVRPLLMTSRIRCVPASGANVRPLRFPELLMMLAMSSSKRSTRWLGSESETFSLYSSFSLFLIWIPTDGRLR